MLLPPQMFLFLLLLLCDITLVAAWTVVPPPRCCWTTRRTTTITSIATTTTTQLFSSSSSDNNTSSDKKQKKEQQPQQVDASKVNAEIERDNIEGSGGVGSVISFDDAGKGLLEEENAIRMEQADGDFDATSYSSDNVDKMREAIRQRTSEMGLEKSVVSKQLIQQASDRAKASFGSGNTGAFGNIPPPSQQDDNQQQQSPLGLDLTKVRGTVPEDMPTMLYDPEEEMTEDEMKQVDPISQESIVKQALNELQNSKWPSLGSALREVVLMLAVVAITAVLVIAWDGFLRDFYTQQLHLIPTKDEINMRFEGLELPDGWTNTMTDDDVANFPGTGGVATTTSGSSDAAASGSGGVSLPDL